MPDNDFDEYAPAAWTAPREQDFFVPSGGKVLVRRVDILDLLGDGMLTKLDFMTDIVSTQVQAAQNPGKAAPIDKDALATKMTGTLLTDTKQKDEFKKIVDRIVLRVVVKPEINPIPVDPEGNEARERMSPGLIYVDSIPFTDKVAIFNWAVTGKNAQELQQFREDSEGPLGDVESVESVPDASVTDAPPL